MRQFPRYAVIIVILAATLAGFARLSHADVEWKLFVLSNFSQPITVKTTGFGEPYLVNASDYARIPGDAQDILSALEGVSFVLHQAPSVSSVTIRIILNNSGGRFLKVNGLSLFLNITFEVYVNGVKNESISFDRSPLELTIPSDALGSFLTLCEMSSNDLLCVYYEGGKYSIDGVMTSNRAAEMVVKIDKPAQVLGGIGEKFNLPSNTRVDTWSKIKLLFR